jgi:hypothetical protein
LMNKSKEAIINIYSDVGESLMSDINDSFGEELYVDGNATGNSKRIHGLESFFGTSGAAAQGYVGTPSDTYCGLRTDLGQYGGSWAQSGGNPTWPSGSGDAHYDFWSPLIVDYTDASWAAGTDNWANNAIEALRFGIIKSKKNATKTGVLDYITLEDDMYRDLMSVYDSKVSVNVNRNQDVGLVALGFGDVVNFEGCEVTYEYGMPDAIGYGLNVDHIMLMSLQDQLFKVEGPDYDSATKSWRTSVDFFGNMWVNPRYQVKWVNIT